jgi:tyrosyl-tRNA synthetase
MGGDLEKIKKVGKYFIEVWKAAGIDTKKVQFIWANEIIESEYWKKVFIIAENSTISRTKRALSIMGRKETELSETSQLFYPMMQVADIFQLDVDICQLGMDQRRANLMAREIAQKFKWKIPIAVHHHMLMGLQGIKKPDTKVDFRSAKHWLVRAESEIKFFGELLKKLKPDKHFAKNTAVDEVMLEGRKYDVIHKWPRRITEIRNMFSDNPRKLNSLIISEIPSIVADIKSLEPLLINAIEKDEPILADEWSEWISKYDKIAPEIHAELLNRARKEKTEYIEDVLDSKMSKSKPSSAIFIHDSKKEIQKKLRVAFCEPKNTNNNPILDYCKEIVFRSLKEFKIERDKKFGGDVSFSSYRDLERAFIEGSLHPMDLKNSTSVYLNKLIAPIRNHFEKNKKAKDLYEFVKKQEVTR